MSTSPIHRAQNTGGSPVARAMKDLQDLRSRLQAADQSHLIAHAEELEQDDLVELVNNLFDIDYIYVNQLRSKVTGKPCLTLAEQVTGDIVSGDYEKRMGNGNGASNPTNNNSNDAGGDGDDKKLTGKITGADGAADIVKSPKYKGKGKGEGEETNGANGSTAARKPLNQMSANEVAAATSGQISSDEDLYQYTDLRPINSIQMLSEMEGERRQKLVDLGKTAIAQGKVACLILGGGQGTRLGLDGPKGLFELPKLPSEKSIYQLFAERVIHLENLCSDDHSYEEKERIPFIVMTSPINHQITVKFFEDNDFFGLHENQCMFFQQGMLPAFDPNGKIIMESTTKAALSPDGNGGIFPSMKKAGIVEACEKLGVEWFHVAGIDNILLKPCDLAFIGYCIEQDVEVGNKSVMKAHWEEKVGVVCLKDDKPSVVEYSEMDEVEKKLMKKDGTLLFGAGNICNHVFRLSFLKNKVLSNLSNVYHIAEKKVPYWDSKTWKTVKPEAINGIKLEAFIFDVFPMADKFCVLECARHEEFAPIKNAEGGDSPESAFQMLKALHAGWLKEAGAKIDETNDNTVMAEISPLLFTGTGDAAELAQLKRIVGHGADATGRCHVERAGILKK